MGQSHQPEQLFFITFFMYSKKNTFCSQIFQRSHSGIEARSLDQAAHAGADILQFLSRVPEQGDLSAGGLRQSGDHSQKGGLSGSVSSDQTVDGSLADMNAHAVNRFLMPVPFGQVIRCE